jgi:hypothetical protein
MKETTYRFSHEHDPALAGKEFAACETATPGLVVVRFIETDGGEEYAPALTHAPSGWAIIHGTEHRDAEELGKTAGALGGLPVDWTLSGAEVLRATAELDDYGFRIFMLLVKGKKRLTKAQLDSERLDIAKRAANVGAERMRQAKGMRA